MKSSCCCRKSSKSSHSKSHSKSDQSPKHRNPWVSEIMGLKRKNQISLRDAMRLGSNIRRGGV